MTEGPREMDPKADTPRETAKRFLAGGRIVEHVSYDNPKGPEPTLPSTLRAEAWPARSPGKLT